MSENNKFVLEKGKFNLNRTSKDKMEANPNRPTMWGKLRVPDGVKGGDTLKLSAWSGISQAGNKYLNGKVELEEKPTDPEKEKVGSEVSEDDLPF
tara:strand:+ start:712 stop:996 length:285 start_codon:yes stop_codon:yes gene_type:complete